MAKRVCKLHGEPLVHGLVENRTGMPPAPPEGYMEALETVFPRSNTFVLGGCLVPQPPKSRVYYCRECRKQEKAWQSSREVDEFWKV